METGTIFDVAGLPAACMVLSCIRFCKSGQIAAFLLKLSDRSRERVVLSSQSLPSLSLSEDAVKPGLQCSNRSNPEQVSPPSGTPSRMETHIPRLDQHSDQRRIHSRRSLLRSVAMSLGSVMDENPPETRLCSSFPKR